MMYGSEGLCPHCKHKEYCGDSTQKTNKSLRDMWKEGQKDLTGGSEDWNKIGCGPCPGLTYCIEYCNEQTNPDREYYFKEE